MDDGRAAVLEDLIAFARPLDDLLTDLRKFPWDCEEELVQLRNDQSESW